MVKTILTEPLSDHLDFKPFLTKIVALKSLDVSCLCILRNMDLICSYYSIGWSEYFRCFFTGKHVGKLEYGTNYKISVTFHSVTLHFQTTGNCYTTTSFVIVPTLKTTVPPILLHFFQSKPENSEILQKEAIHASC